MYLSEYISPLGKIVMTSNGETLYSLTICGKTECSEVAVTDYATYEKAPAPGFGLSANGLKTSAQDSESGDLPGQATAEMRIFAETRRWLDAYFSGNSLPVPMLDFAGLTAHQIRVYERLMLVGYGETTTYAKLSAATGSSPRAVGNALARNRHLLVIPCHRCLKSDDTLGGFSGGNGVETKLALLSLEKEKSQKSPAL